MSSPGIMIAAPKSGSGKTMITCALLELLKERFRFILTDFGEKLVRVRGLIMFFLMHNLFNLI